MSQFSKTSPFYWGLRVYTNFIYKRWFSSVEVNGAHNIPEGEPVIFAPNHQNAFMDAMALLSSSPQPVVFWAKADIFSNKLMSAILRAIKIMPAYRMRNGFGNLKKNEESIKESDDVLTHHLFLCLMPEGGQDEKRRLRPLVKGIFRSAFSAQEKLPAEDWVKIVPTGIDYGHYDKSGRHLVVNFGRPMSLKDYKQLHDENAPVALNTMRDDLSKRMEPLMLDIQSVENYDTFYTASYLYNLPMLDVLNIADNETNRLAARKYIVEALHKAEKDEQCARLLSELKTLCEAWSATHQDTAFCARMQEYEGLDTDLIVKAFYLVLTSPLYLVGLVANLPTIVAAKIMGKKTRGTGFEASVKFGLAGFLSPILYLIETLFYAIYLAPDALTTVAFFLILPFSAMFYLKYRWRCQYVVERFRNLIKKPSEPTSIKSIIQQIISITRNS